MSITRSEIMFHVYSPFVGLRLAMSDDVLK